MIAHVVVREVKDLQLLAVDQALREVLNELGRKVAEGQLEPLQTVCLGDALAQSLPSEPARIHLLKVKRLDLAQLQVATQPCEDRLVKNAALRHLSERYVCIRSRVRDLLASVQILLLLLDPLIVVEVALNLCLRDAHGLSPELNRCEALEFAAKYPQHAAIVLGLAIEV